MESGRDDLELSFRTPVEQLERFMNLDPLPSWVGSDVQGAFRVHLMVVDNEPFAELEGASLYGIPVPLSLLGAAAHGNWFERLDADLVLALGSRLLERIPLIETAYSGVRDLMQFVSRPANEDSRRVVLVTLPGDIYMVGFITDSTPARSVPELRADGEKVVAVYLPMRCQIGGYTMYLPERYVRRLVMPVEEVMRMVLTAGLVRMVRGRATARDRTAATGGTATNARDVAVGSDEMRRLARSYRWATTRWSGRAGGIRRRRGA